MGMFDSLYDEHGNEWQTKAFDCNLDEYRTGDTMPVETREPFQVEVLHGYGSWPDRGHIDAFATVRDGVLVAVGVERDESLPRVSYFGHLSTPAPRPVAAEQTTPGTGEGK